jgi:hypothetical protein
MTISSITRQGTFEPFGLQVARNQIQGHSHVIVFGYNPDVDTSEESVWPADGTVPHPSAASVLKISSSNTNDAAAGTGARKVFIEGLDGDYNVVGETVILNGQTAVDTVNSYLYVNTFTVTEVGSGEKNAGNINAGTGVVTAGVPAVLYDVIAAGYNNRTTAHYCVPAGFTGFMVTGVVTAGKTAGTHEVTVTLQQHDPTSIVRVGAVTTLSANAVQYDFDPPYAIPEKNCVGAVAKGTANNNSVSSFFNIFLVKNGA